MMVIRHCHLNNFWGMETISKISLCAKIGLSVQEYALLGNVFMFSNDWL
jgi:hypothetical protein